MCCDEGMEGGEEGVRIGCEDDHTSKHTQIESENFRRRFQFRIRGRGSGSRPMIDELYIYIYTRLKKKKKKRNDARRGAQNRGKRRFEKEGAMYTVVKRFVSKKKGRGWYFKSLAVHGSSNGDKVCTRVARSGIIAFHEPRRE